MSTTTPTPTVLADGQVVGPPGQVPDPALQAYLKMGARVGFNPPDADSLNMKIDAEAGSGKTTFVASIPDAIIIDADGGAHSVVGARAVSIPLRGPEVPADSPHGFDLYARIVAQLLEDAQAGKSPFRTVVIDSVDAWADLVAEHLVDEINRKRARSNQPNAADRTIQHIGEYGSSGAGYKLLYHYLLRDLNLLAQAGYRWVVVCHLHEKNITVGNQEQTVVRAVSYPGLDDLLKLRADVIMSIECRVRPRVKRDDRGRIVGKETVRSYIAHVQSDFTRTAKRRLFNIDGSIELPLVDGYKAWRDYYEQKRQEALEFSRNLSLQKEEEQEQAQEQEQEKEKEKEREKVGKSVESQ